MRPRVDFFYDFSCPYAYLAHTEVEAVCDKAGAELVWKPFLLGGVFKAIGSAGPQMPPAKARHNLLDMYRWAAHLGVPLRMPPGHPNRTVLALRATLAAGADLARASKAMYRAYWVDALDISEPSVVRSALDGVGLDGAALLARAEMPEIKDELRKRTDEAIAVGVFGAPTFLVRTAGAPDGDLFWGQDRMMFVDKALAGWRPPPPGAGL